MAGAVAGPTAVVNHLSPTSCMAGGTRRGTTRGERLQEGKFNCPRSRTAVTRQLPAFGRCGRKATTTVTHCRDGHALRRVSSSTEPIRDAIWRNECFKPIRTKSHRACQLLLAQLFEQDAEDVIFKVHGCCCQRGRRNIEPVLVQDDVGRVWPTVLPSYRWPHM